MTSFQSSIFCAATIPICARIGYISKTVSIFTICEKKIYLLAFCVVAIPARSPRAYQFFSFWAKYKLIDIKQLPTSSSLVLLEN